MRSTMSQANKKNKANKLMECLKAPLRMFTKAMNLYVNSLSDCSGKASYGGVQGLAPQATSLPKSFSVASSRSVTDDEDFRRLIRTVSKQQSPQHAQPGALGSTGVGRSFSVGIGRIGKIDEDSPCDFVDENDKVDADLLYPRSKSHAVGRRNVVYY